MKRFSCMLAACLLVLNGCTRNAAVDNKISEESAATEVQTVKSDFYIKGNLPDIGSFSGAGKYVRFYDEYTPEFIPSDEYGVIVPFIGKTKVYETPKDTEDSFFASSVYSDYGFCTADGRVVVDPNPGIQYITQYESNDGFVYYQYSIVPIREQEAREYDFFVPGEGMLVPQSGKWCLKLPKGAWVSGAANGYIIVAWVSEDNTEEYPIADCVRVYDYDGNLVREIKDVQNADIYSQGVMLLRDYSIEPYDVRFVNLDGETVFGPFEWATSFNDYGIAIVEEYNGDCYFIDAVGNRITNTNYSNINEIYGNKGVVGYQAKYSGNKRKNDVYALDGSLLCTYECKSENSRVSICEDTVIVNYYDDGDDLYYYMDGTPFVSKEFGVSPNRYVNVDGVFVNCDDETKHAVVFNHKGETLFELDEVEYFGTLDEKLNFATYSSGAVEYIWDEISDGNIVVNTEKQHIYDVKQQKDILTFDGSGYCQFLGENDRYILISIDTTDGMFSSVYNYHLYDTLTERMLFEDCMNIEYYNVNGKDYFNVCKKNETVLYDENFNVLIRQIND